METLDAVVLKAPKQNGTTTLENSQQLVCASGYLFLQGTGTVRSQHQGERTLPGTPWHRALERQIRDERLRSCGRVSHRSGRSSQKPAHRTGPDH